MDRVARITVLADNTVKGSALLAEHGLALWIEIDDRHLLFDTGQGAVLSHNAKSLRVDVKLADGIILSHGHYDHTGGLADALEAAPEARLYAHPAAFGPKYLRNTDGTSRAIGIPASAEQAAHEHHNQVSYAEGPTEVGPGCFASGEIPRRTDYEDTGGPFFTDAECQRPDPLVDDQALFLDSRGGTVVLLGCAHAGVVNTLHYIRELTGDKPIRAVIGGMHLAAASRKRMDRTIDDLRRLDVESLGPAHCTGIAATAQLWHAFPDRCFSCTVGTTIAFELP